MNAAAMVRLSKVRRPADYCAHPGCLWRIMTRGQSTPCPRHPRPTPPAEPTQEPAA